MPLVIAKVVALSLAIGFSAEYIRGAYFWRVVNPSMAFLAGSSIATFCALMNWI